MPKQLTRRAVLVLGCLWLSLCPAHAQAKAKHVIIMISDGCGFNQYESATLFRYGRPGAAFYQQPGWVHAAVSTYSANGKGYDPARAWTDPAYLKANPTDSAAAATALSTGVKTYDAAIGVDLRKQPLKHLGAWAEEVGKSTGVITTVPLCHATPAGFVAHNDHRDHYEALANEMLLSSATDVIMGGGHPLYDANGELRKNPSYKYVGGEATWLSLVNGQAGGDADGDGAADPWSLLESREQFAALAEGKLVVKRPLGVAKVAETLQERRAKGRPLNTDVPDLALMTRGALNTLGRNPRGLFLMIEGGAIDWACHENLFDRMVPEQLDFCAAVEAVVAWVEAKSNWSETLLVLTADHETGYLTGPDVGGVLDPRTPLLNRGIGELPGFAFHSKSHTNSLVPLYARGVGAEQLLARATRDDPVRGRYLDNIEIPQVVRSLLVPAAAK